MAKRPERKNTYMSDIGKAIDDENTGFNKACDLWEAYEKESEISRKEIISIMEECYYDIGGCGVGVDIEKSADSILAAMKQKKGGK